MQYSKSLWQLIINLLHFLILIILSYHLILPSLFLHFFLMQHLNLFISWLLNMFSLRRFIDRLFNCLNPNIFTCLVILIIVPDLNLIQILAKRIALSLPLFLSLKFCVLFFSFHLILPFFIGLWLNLLLNILLHLLILLDSFSCLLYIRLLLHRINRIPFLKDNFVDLLQRSTWVLS